MPGLCGGRQQLWRTRAARTAALCPRAAAPAAAPPTLCTPAPPPTRAVDAPQVGKVTMDQVREIAAIKLPDLNCTDLDAACATVMGTAKNMGITVEA